MAETWRQIPGHPGYEVSDHGRVRSMDRFVMLRNGRLRRLKGRSLKPGVSSNGYQTVALGAGNSRCVHELVLVTFVGPRPKGQVGFHKDDVRSNNRLSNLRWDTYSANSKNITRLGKRKFSYDEAENIKNKLLSGGDALLMSKKLGCTRRHLYHIKLGAQYVRD